MPPKKYQEVDNEETQEGDNGPVTPAVGRPKRAASIANTIGDDQEDHEDADTDDDAPASTKLAKSKKARSVAAAEETDDAPLTQVFSFLTF